VLYLFGFAFSSALSNYESAFRKGTFHSENMYHNKKEREKMTSVKRCRMLEKCQR
jgi:hypothetical protein